MSDDLVPRVIEWDGDSEPAGATPPPSEDEHAELTALAELTARASHFELSRVARARGLEELEHYLAKRDERRARARPIVTWWWSVPLAAAVLLAWLLPVSPKGAPAAASPDELAIAQNAALTARLTGAPIPRDDLERAQASYRKRLLAALEHER